MGGAWFAVSQNLGPFSRIWSVTHIIKDLYTFVISRPSRAWTCEMNSGALSLNRIEICPPWGSLTFKLNSDVRTDYKRKSGMNSAAHNYTSILRLVSIAVNLIFRICYSDDSKLFWCYFVILQILDLYRIHVIDLVRAYQLAVKSYFSYISKIVIFDDSLEVRLACEWELSMCCAWFAAKLSLHHSCERDSEMHISVIWNRRTHEWRYGCLPL